MKECTHDTNGVMLCEECVNALDAECAELERQNKDWARMYAEAQASWEKRLNIVNLQYREALNEIKSLKAVLGMSEKRNHEAAHDKETCDHFMCRESRGLPHLETCTCIVCERKKKV